MKKQNIALAFLFYVSCYSYETQRIEINSDHIDENLHATVVVPDSYSKRAQHYSTVYWLHGWSGNDKDWTEKMKVAMLADDDQLMIVMPHGDDDKGYINSPVLAKSQYEKYIGSNVPSFIDKHFRSIAAKNGRTITGLSTSCFGAAGSISGGVDPP